MSHSIAAQQLAFDDFHKDEYRAFKLEGQPDCISIPTIRDRLQDILVQLERQMEAGDHLAITLTVSRPSPEAGEDDPVGNIIARNLRQYCNPYSGARFP